MEQLARSPLANNSNKPHLKQALSELGEATREQIIHTKEAAAEQTRKVAHAVDESAHKSPWLYVGAAAVLAGVAGFFLGRKS